MLLASDEIRVAMATEGHCSQKSPLHTDAMHESCDVKGQVAGISGILQCRHIIGAAARKARWSSRNGAACSRPIQTRARPQRQQVIRSRVGLTVATRHSLRWCGDHCGRGRFYPGP